MLQSRKKGKENQKQSKIDTDNERNFKQDRDIVMCNET